MTTWSTGPTVARARRGLDLGSGASAGSHLLGAFTNFVLAVTCARVLLPNDFGTFAQGYALFLLVRGLALAWCAEPLLVHAGRSPEAVSVFAGSVRTSLLVAVPGSVVLVACGAADVIGGTFAVLFGAFLPIAIVQDLLRIRMIASGRGSTALRAEMIWVTVSLPALVWLGVRDGELTFLTAPVLVWIAGGVLAAVFGCWCLIGEVRVAERAPLSRLRSSFALEFLLGAGTVLVLETLLAIAGDEQASAGFRAAQTVFLPLTTLVGAVRVVAIPRLAGSGWSVAIVSAVRFGVALIVGVVLVAAVTLHDLAGVGRLLLGDQLELARELIPWHAGIRVFAVVIAMATIVLRSQRVVRRAVVAGGLTAVVVVGVAGPAALTGSALNLSIALSVTTAVGAMIWVTVTSRVARITAGTSQELKSDGRDGSR